MMDRSVSYLENIQYHHKNSKKKKWVKNSELSVNTMDFIITESLVLMKAILFH